MTVYVMSVATLRRHAPDAGAARTSRCRTTVYVGLYAVCAQRHGEASARCSATSASRFRRRKISCRTATTSAASWRFWIVESGNRSIIHRYTGSFQAPNWTRDGTTLIYNQRRKGAAVYDFDLATRTPSVLNTGFARRNNNDHVLSFDGTMLGISSQVTEENTRRSSIPCQRAEEYRHESRRRDRRICTVGRRTSSGSCTPASGTASSTSTRSPHRRRRRDQAHGDERRGRWARVHTGWRVDLLQLSAHGPMQIWRMRADGSSRSR